MRHRDVHLVPLLGAGAHTHPRRGGCLLELVSTLPGGAWTDHPPGMDPVVGVLARAVNDATSSDQRPALAPLIPYLAALPPVPGDEAAAAVVTACTRAALADVDPASAGALTRAAATATDLFTLGGDRWWLHRARRRTAIRTVRLTVRTLTRRTVHGRAGTVVDPDRALAALLTEALNRVRRLAGQPAVPALARPAAACRVSVPVHSELRAPDGAESLYHHASALTDAWPPWLLDTCSDAHTGLDQSRPTARSTKGRPSDRRRPPSSHLLTPLAPSSTDAPTPTSTVSTPSRRARGQP
jgi:hypothetical protein